MYNVFKINQLHVDIFSVFLYCNQDYSMNYSKWIGNFPKVLNFNKLFLKLNQFLCNYTKYVD